MGKKKDKIAHWFFFYSDYMMDENILDILGEKNVFLKLNCISFYFCNMANLKKIRTYHGWHGISRGQDWPRGIMKG